MTAELVEIVDRLRAQRAHHARIVDGLDRAVGALDELLTLEEKSALWLRGFEDVPAAGEPERVPEDDHGCWRDDRGVGDDGGHAPVAAESVGVGGSPADTDGDVSPAPELEVDYERVAEVARAAIAEGRASAEAVVAEFACSPATARQRILRARQLGLDIPAAPAHPARGQIDYDQVARVALAAREAGSDMVGAVAEAQGVSRTTAEGRIMTARRKALLPPGRPGRPPAEEKADCRECGQLVKPSAMAAHVLQHHPKGSGLRRPVADPVVPKSASVVLLCEDCGLEFATDRVLDLRDHVNMEHNRKPRTSERTPQPRRSAS